VLSVAVTEGVLEVCIVVEFLVLQEVFNNKELKKIIIN
jgi:hypothetical protein